ncbi:rho-associated protein kinase 1-like isoform X2 [Mya arenaria]|uniref:rho-associated protein kinase 1-like isoform X2 n=2 Tax=Mya arenaria TaxID=6604 RepID=UPI0022E0667A|nr:rho-associated protein kinase 1-like isoform X2 [Mya arenaria]
MMASAPASRSIYEDTISRRASPVPPKPSLITKKRDDDHELKQEPFLLKDSDKGEESLQFTFKCIEEAMCQPEMYVLGLQKMLSTVKTHKTIEQQLRDENNTLQISVEEHKSNVINLNAVLQDALETVKIKHETSTRMEDELKSLKVALLQKEEEIKKKVTEYKGKISALEIEQATSINEYKITIEKLNKKINALNEVNELQIEKITDLSTELQQRNVDLETIQTHDEHVLNIQRQNETKMEDQFKTLKVALLQTEEEIQKKVTENEGKISALDIKEETTLNEHKDTIENPNNKINALNRSIQKHCEQDKFNRRKKESCDVANTGFKTSKIELRYMREEVLTKLTEKMRQSRSKHQLDFGAWSLDVEGRMLLQGVRMHLESEIKNIKSEIEVQKHSQMTAEKSAISQIDYLKKKIQKQRDHQLVAETFSNEEITKLEEAMKNQKRSLKLIESFAETEISTLEDEIEERKRIQSAAEKFAEKELDKLEIQLREQKSNQRFAKKNARAEILKLEEAIENQKRSLKLAETFAETELSTLEERIKKKENTLKQVQIFAEGEITRLEEEVNGCLHLINVLEAEAASLRSDGGKPTKSTNDNGPQLGKMYHMERDMKQKNVYQQMKLDEKEREIEELKGQTSISEESKIHMDGWLDVSKFGWDKLFVVVSLHYVTFFESLEKKQKASPVFELDIYSILEVRSAKWEEVPELTTKDVSRKFVLVYDKAGEKVHGPLLPKKKVNNCPKNSGYHCLRRALADDADESNSGKLILQADTKNKTRDWVDHISKICILSANTGNKHVQK